MEYIIKGQRYDIRVNPIECVVYREGNLIASLSDNFDDDFFPRELEFLMESVLHQKEILGKNPQIKSIETKLQV